MSNTKTKATIIVPTFNQAPLTVRCFESIKRNTQSDYELLWVDNGSAQNQFEAIYRAVKRLNIVTKLVRFKRNQGFIRATNAGIREASGEYVLLLNNDTEVGFHWDESLIKPLHNIEVGAVGPITQSKIAWQEVVNVNRRWHKNIPEFQGTVDSYSKILDRNFGGEYIEITTGPLAFFCVAMRRETFAEIGFLDEAYGIGLADDDDFCMRLRLAGMTLMLSLGAFVHHCHRTTFKAIGANVDSLLRTNLKILKDKKQQFSNR